jgi:hypothetical protein
LESSSGHLCLLGAIRRLGLHSRPADLLLEAIRSPPRNLATARALRLSHLHHPSANTGRRGACLAAGGGAGAGQIRGHWLHRLRAMLFYSQAIAACPSGCSDRLIVYCGELSLEGNIAH